MKKLGLKNHLCSICLRSFSLLRLKKVSGQSVCPFCFRLIKKHSKPLEPKTEISEPVNTGEYIEPNEGKIINLINNNKEEFISGVKSITPWVLWLMGLRVVAYLGSSFLFDTHGSVYAILNGIMLGDFSTWLLFSIMQLPFAGQAFVYEFAVYSGITAFLGGTGKILLFAPPSGEAIGIACLAFILTGFIKTAIWAVKTFGVIYS